MLKMNKATIRANVLKEVKGLVDKCKRLLREEEKVILSLKKRKDELYNCLGGSYMLSRDKYPSAFQNERNINNQIFQGGYTQPAISWHAAQLERIEFREKMYIEYYSLTDKLSELDKNLRITDTRNRKIINDELRRLETIEYEKLRWIFDNL